MDRKMKAVYAVVLLGIVAIYIAALWQPARQVQLHQTNLLRAVEKRNWERFASFMADDYSDRWGHDKEFVLRESREVFRQFLFLTVRQEVRAMQIGDQRGTVLARIELTGSGGPLASVATERVNALSKPFTFRWRQRSWKPWDWQLVDVDQPELELSEM
jgi:hypothetical protein